MAILSVQATCSSHSVLYRMHPANRAYCVLLLSLMALMVYAAAAQDLDSRLPASVQFRRLTPSLDHHPSVYLSVHLRLHYSTTASSNARTSSG